MEAIEVPTEKHENTEWNFWNLQDSHEDRWIKSISNSTNLFLVEVGFHDRLIKCSEGFQQSCISWVSYVELVSKIQSSLSSDDALEILIEEFGQICVAINCSSDCLHLYILSVKVRFQVQQFLLLCNVSIELSVQMLKIFIPLIHEVESKSGS